MGALMGAEVELIPAWLYVIGPLITMVMGGLSATVIMHYRKVQSGKLVPEATVERMRAQYESHLVSMRTTYEAQITSLRTDSNDWRGAYHLLSENAKTSEDRMDEVLETSRLMLAFVRALPNGSNQGDNPHD